MATLLKVTDIQKRLKEMEGWSYEGDSLVKTFERADFVDSVEFLEEMVPLAEDMNHHPDVTIKDYNRVKVSITTHDEGGVTELDFRLARKIDRL